MSIAINDMKNVVTIQDDVAAHLPREIIKTPKFKLRIEKAAVKIGSFHIATENAPKAGENPMQQHTIMDTIFGVRRRAWTQEAE